MSTPESAAIIEAMKSDLGADRVNDLDLENGRPGRSMRPGPIFHKPVVVRMPAASRNALASKWQTAVQEGEFDDDDAEAVKGLARIGGGRLHAQNNNSAAFGQNAAFKPDFFPPPPTLTAGSHTPRMPGAFPRSPSATPNGRQQSQHSPFGGSPGTTSMGVVPNGPVVRFVPGRASPAAPRAHAMPSRPENTTPPTASPLQPLRPTQNFAATNAVPNTASPMPPTPPQDIKNNDQEMTGEDEPREYFYKADIQVADLRAKGPGVVYLLDKNAEATGIFSVFLEGQHYLEYTITSMKDYLTSSDGLWFMFKEADGVSVTTTSLLFKSQAEISDFMKALRALKAKVHKATKSSDQKVTAAGSQAEISLEHASASSTLVPPSIDALLETQPTKVDGKKSTPQAEKPTADIQIKVEGDTDEKPDLQSIPIFEPEKEEAAGEQRPTRDHSEMSISKETATSTAHNDTTTELLDLSQPVQAPSPKRHQYSDRTSAYAMDLGSLDTLISTDSQSQNAETSSTSMEIVPISEQLAASGTSHQEAPQESQDVTDDATSRPENPAQSDYAGTRDMLRGYLIHILPLFREMKRIMGSVEEDDREAVAKAVFASSLSEIGRMYGHDKTLPLTAKEVLLALLTPKGNASSSAARPLKPPSNGPMYSSGEILSLRSTATSPPPQLDQLEFLPRRKSIANQIGPTRVKRDSVSSVGNSGRRSRPVDGAVRPSAAVAVTKVAETDHSVTTGTMPIQTESLSTISNNQVPTSHVAQSSTTETTLVKAVAAPPAPALAAPKKGLSGSRWAAGSSSIRPENENHFTGIDFPHKRS